MLSDARKLPGEGKWWWFRWTSESMNRQYQSTGTVRTGILDRRNIWAEACRDEETGIVTQTANSLVLLKFRMRWWCERLAMRLEMSADGSPVAVYAKQGRGVLGNEGEEPLKKPSQRGVESLYLLKPYYGFPFKSWPTPAPFYWHSFELGFFKHFWLWTSVRNKLNMMSQFKDKLIDDR